jgi:hypothetical protein
LFVLTALNRPHVVTAVDGIDFAVIQPRQAGTAE